MQGDRDLDTRIRELEGIIDAWRSERQKFQQIQREWQENKERWQLILQGGNDAIWDWNPRTQELFVSPRWKEMLGYGDEELTGHFETWKNLLHPDDLDRVLDCLQAYLAREIPEYRIEFRLRCKDGNYKWILARGQALWDETGQAIRVAGSHTDIDDRLQRVQALQRQAERDNLLTRITRALIEEDIDRAIDPILAAIGSFTGASRSYIIQYSPCRQQWSMVYEWCDPRDRSIAPIIEQSRDLKTETYPWFSRQLLNGIPIRVNSIEDIPPTAIAEREVLLASPTPRLLVVPMLDSLGETVGYLGLDAKPEQRWTREDMNFIRLVGELVAIARARHLAETSLKEAKEAADKANRAKSEFLANMSHELRTPLNAILGFTRLMARDGGLTPAQRDYLGIVNRSGEHLLALINDILEMSKIEAGKTSLNPRSFDFYELLSDIEQMLQPQATGKGLTLLIDRPEDFPRYVYGDESKLRQVLINLLGNALKFTLSGGVALRMRAEREEDAYRLFFEVEDTGPGIAPEDLPYLFEPFTQTETGRKIGQGTGLGLPIGRKFARLMGGDLTARSVVGGGSVFAFDILVTPTEREAIQSAFPSRKVIGIAPGRARYRILAVDDRPESRLLLMTLLSSAGLATRTAANGQEAIEIWREWRPHLIWMDMRMPVMDGYTATREIRRLEGERKTTIIALTASAFEEERAQVIAAGCDDFVRKPFQEEIIWQKMAHYLGISYLYAEDGEAFSEEEFPLEPLRSGLAAMDRGWLDRLRQAAVECDDERVIRLTASIPPENAELAIGLQQLANRFLFDTIVRLIEDVNIS